MVKPTYVSFKKIYNKIRITSFPKPTYVPIGNHMKILIFESDPWSKNSLIKLLGDYFPEIQVVQCTSTIIETKNVILAQKPDIVFTNIEREHFSISEFLENINSEFPYFIITSSIPEYAYRQNFYEVIAYLIKPVTLTELTNVINIAKKRIRKDRYYEDSKNREHLKSKFIGFLEMGNIMVIRVAQIVYLKSAGEQTYFYLEDGSLKITAKRIGEYEKLLPMDLFLRIHKQYMANMSFVTNARTHPKTIIHIKKLGVTLPVSYRKRNTLLRFLKIKT